MLHFATPISTDPVSAIEEQTSSVGIGAAARLPSRTAKTIPITLMMNAKGTSTA
jgi:hypothetical protein